MTISTHAQQFVGLTANNAHEKSVICRCCRPGCHEKRVRRAGRHAQLLLITLVMSRPRGRTTKLLLVGFAGSVALICVLYVVTWCVARPADGLRWAALAVVVLAIGLAAWCIPRLVRLAEIY